mgnify:CR=1 FL=1
MSNRTPAIVSAILTALLLIGLAGFSLFFEMVALNGGSERQGMTAMGISLACQGIGIILMGFLAAWGTHLMISKFNWNKMLAVAVAVLVSVVPGGTLSFVSLIIGIPLAGMN